MKVFSTAFFYEGDQPTRLNRIDTIEYKGLLWLVTDWREERDGIPRKPARMIRLTGLGHQEIPENNPVAPGCHFLVTGPLSKNLIEGRSQSQAGRHVVVLEGDAIEDEPPSAVH